MTAMLASGPGAQLGPASTPRSPPGTSPGQNFVYADTQGNIGYQATGRGPIRKQGNGLVPVDGATGDNEWTGFVPYDKLPTRL